MPTIEIRLQATLTEFIAARIALAKVLEEAAELEQAARARLSPEDARAHEALGTVLALLARAEGPTSTAALLDLGAPIPVPAEGTRRQQVIAASRWLSERAGAIAVLPTGEVRKLVRVVYRHAAGWGAAPAKGPA